MIRGLSSFWRQLVEADNDVGRILELIAHRAVEVVGDACIVATLSADGRRLEPVAAHHADPVAKDTLEAFLSAAPYPIDRGVQAAVVAGREPVVLAGVTRDELVGALAPDVPGFLGGLPVHSVAVVPLVGSGEVIGVLGAARMTSERPYSDEDVMALEALAERAALALAEAKLHPSVIGIAEYEAFFRHSIDGVIFAASNGRILAANPAACDILGRSEADIARAGRSGVFVAEDRTRAAFAHLARHGGVRAELPMRRGTGEVFTADVASTLFMTDEGELRATTIFRDATERVRAQEQLARQRDRLALLHLVSTAINQATDMDEAVRETLDPVGEATGWPVGDVMLLGDDGIIRPSPIWRIPDAERFGWFRGWVVSMSLPAGEGLAGRVIASATPMWVEDLSAEPAFIRRGPPAEVPLVSYVGAPIMVGSRARGALELFSDERRPRDDELLAVLIDLGTQLGRALERTETEEARRRLDEDRAAFVARAAHELRSPVTSLMLAVGVLAGHELLREQDRQLVELIEESTEHLNRLVHRLLDLSTLERSLPPLTIEPVDVAHVIDQALVTSPVPAGQLVSLQLPPGIEVLADELSLEQILVNLLRNAYSYGDGEIHIEVEAADGRVRLSVTDNGPGVDPAIEDRLFESFVRGTDQRVAGAGLGLPISRGLAEAMGGSMHYERADEGGSRFTVELPAPS